MEEHEHVRLGDWVVLASSDGKRVLANVTPNAVARFGREKRNVGDLLGARWGALYHSVGNKLEACSEVLAEVEHASGDVDNRTLHDTNASQRLTERDITRLKLAARGAEVVEQVAANSATFARKTKFSQEKYLRRKRAKFDLRVRIVRPTAHELCATYFARAPEKMLHMRPDALALVIGYGGVVARRHVLVVDQTVGLLTAAVAERLAGYGRALNFFKGSTPPSAELLKMLNLKRDVLDAVVNVPLELLHSVDKTEDGDDTAIKYAGTGHCTEAVQAISDVRAKAIARRPRRGLVKQWLKDGFNCLVMAVESESVELIDLLIPFLAPSGTLAVYCTHLQEAAELQYALQMSKMAIRVELTESMLLHHQMLPGRSHPLMTDSATGGYVVSGVRIELPSDVNGAN